MPWFVYMVECSDESLYTGITNNLPNRIDKHNSKKGAKYTQSRTPVELVFTERKRNRGYAMKREIEIKKFTPKRKRELIAAKLLKV